MTSNLIDDQNFKVKTSSMETKMIIVADGDIIRNEVSRMETRQSLQYWARISIPANVWNRDFIINCMNYLVDNNGLMELRSREMKLRLSR